MAEGYTVKDVTNDLRFVLAMTNIFEADEEGYWSLPSDEQRYVHKLDKNDEGREIALIQDPMPRGNYLTFNPFSEGMGKQNPANAFFYRSLRVALNQSIMQVCIYVAGEVLESKKAAELKEEFTVSPAVISVSSVPISGRKTVYDVIDEETIEELKKIFARLDNGLIHTPYYTPNMTAKVTCDALTDADFDAKFGKDIRKRTMGVFRSLIMGILQIGKPEDLADFSVKYDPKLQSAARFHTTMMVYFNLYSRFNDLINTAFGFDKYAVDLGSLYTIIERFPKAYAIAKHMMAPTSSTVKPAETKTSDTSTMRFALPGQTAGNNSGRRFAGPQSVDNYGRTDNGGMMSMGQPQTMGSGRFKPNIVSETPTDPFAMVTRANANQNMMGVGGMMGGGMGGGMSFGMGHNSGMSFGGNQNQNQNQFNFNAPSNLGQPGTRTWFGN